MSDTPEKKKKRYYQTALNLPLTHLEMIEKLDSAEKDTAEIKRRGAMKELEKEYRKVFGVEKSAG